MLQASSGGVAGGRTCAIEDCGRLHCVHNSSRDFGEAMRFRGQKLIPFWCLMPKGEKIRPKQ